MPATRLGQRNLSLFLSLSLSLYIYLKHIYWGSISPRHQPSVWRAGGWPWRAGGRADGENWAPTCANLSLLLRNVTPHIILQASGNASWKLPELRKTEYLLQASGKASETFGTFRNCSEHENDWTSFRQRFRKPSGTLVILTSTF